MGETSAALAANIKALVPLLMGSEPSSRSRTEWRFRNKGSLAVIVSGKERGVFFDHEADVGGDALDLVCHLRSCSRKEAWNWAIGWLGRPPETSPPERDIKPRQQRQSKSIELPRTIWREAAAPAGTPVQAYLRSRGLELQPGAPVRYHSACTYRSVRIPAMVALMTDPATNEPTGVHRTFLKPDGSGKAEVERAKMMLGAAGVIRLSPDEYVTEGLGICEGIENGLAILQHVGWAPIWAAGSAGGIARFPVPPGISSLTIFADADDRGAGMEAAHTCADRWRAAGREVTIQRPPTGNDWLEALTRRAAGA